MSQSQSGPAGGQISLPRALVFASAAVPIGALGVAATVHLPRYFAAELGLSLALVGTVFALVRFIDIPIDTAMGLAMDRTKTRFGRYRVWMALGAPVLMLGFYMLLMTGAGDGPLYLGLWLLVMYLGYSGVLLSHLAWAGRLAPTYKERSRIFGAITGLGVIGAIAVLLIPILMSQQGYTDAQGVQAMIWFIIASAAVTCMLVVFTSPERITQDRPAQFTLKDYAQLLTRGNVIRLLAADLMVTLGPGWMAALYLFYFKDSRGFDTASANLLLLIYVAAGFAGAPFAAWLANKISKHIAFLVTTTVYSLGLMCLPFLPKGDFPIFAVLMFLVGAMAAGFTVMMRAIAADIADEDEIPRDDADRFRRGRGIGHEEGEMLRGVTRRVHHIQSPARRAIGRCTQFNHIALSERSAPHVVRVWKLWVGEFMRMHRRLKVSTERRHGL